MKKLLLVCAIVLGVSAMSHAQGRQQRTPEETLAQYKTNLTLTDDQSAKILPILNAQKASTDSLMKASNGDMQSARPAMMAIRTKYNAQIKAVLTADQATKFDAMTQRRGGGGGGNGGGGNGGGGNR